MARTVKNTAENAEAIAQGLDQVNALLQEASHALTAVLDLVETGEKEPEYKTPKLQAVAGAVSLASSALAVEASTWSIFADARTR